MPTVRGDVFTISMSVLTLVTLFKLENAGDVFLTSANLIACSAAEPTFSHQYPSCRIQASRVSSHPIALLVSLQLAAFNKVTSISLAIPRVS